MKMMRMLIFALLIAVIGVMPITAQDDDGPTLPEQRVDQAMAHLTEYLDAPRPITRQTQFWTWREVIHPDSALGCGVPGVDYPALPDRGPQMTITYEDVEYDYRASWDGAILVLCGADGLPLYRSDDPALSPAGDSFFMWVYTPTSDRFHLINSAGGEVAGLPRPTVTNEAPDGLSAMAFTRDGRHLLQVVTLQTGTEALTIFNMATGNLITIPVAAGESISIGTFGIVYSDNLVVADSLIASPDSSRVAFGVYRMDDENPIINDWRMLVVEPSSGAVVAQLTRDQLPAAMTAGGQPLADDAPVMMGAFRPVPVKIDQSGAVHFYLVLLYAGGSFTYPAFAWSPATNTAIESPFDDNSAGISADGRMVYALYDPNYPSEDSFGMIDPRNVIAQVNPTEAASSISYIMTGSERTILTTWWAAEGRQVIFNSFDNDGPGLIYSVYDIASGARYDLPAYGVGAPDGVLTLVGVAGVSQQIVIQRDATTRQAIWNVPPGNPDPVIAWVEGNGRSLNLSALYDGQVIASFDAQVAPPPPAPTTLPVATVAPSPTQPPIAATAPAGETDCGVLASIVSVGMEARSTIIDGATLNLRTAPTTQAQVARILPEGERFFVIGGPICSVGFTWWSIQLSDGLTGWVAEAGDDRYFIEPVSGG